jgi:hypothetical protein
MNVNSHMMGARNKKKIKKEKMQPENSEMEKLEKQMDLLDKKIEYHEKSCPICLDPYGGYNGEYQECLAVDAMNEAYNDLYNLQRELIRAKKE